MKGVIVHCLAQMVEEKFGKERWEKVLEISGMDITTEFQPGRDISDEKMMKLIMNASKVLAITLEKLSEAFGRYWVKTYAQRQYAIYFNRYRTAKDFILGMDRVHEFTTNTFRNAHPPRFKYLWINDKKLRVEYLSSRNLIDFYIGLIKGVSVYYRTPIKVDKISSSKVDLTFGEKIIC